MAKPFKFGKTPNFKDSRNRARALKVLAWAEDRLTGFGKGRRVSSEEIRKVFSNKDQGGPAAWLFTNIMQQTASYLPGKRSNSYRIKRSGLEKVYKALELTPPTEVEVLRRKYADVLAGAPLEYNDTGLRRYHEIQNIKRDLRKAMFEGWYDFDIQGAAPSLINQYAAAYSRAQHDCDLPFPAVARLVRDKAAVRQDVAQLIGLDAQRTKELLTMLFFRANTAAFHKNRVFSILGGDPARLESFLVDPFISEFRSDVERMWEAAFAHDDAERSAAGRRPSQFKRKSKRRMNIYLALERRAMDAILERLAADGVGSILMHDGFMSRANLDIDELAQAVKDATGFEIRLSKELLTASVETEFELDADDIMREVSTDDD